MADIEDVPPRPGSVEGPDAPRLRILQVNCQKCYAVMIELGHVLSEGRYDAALLQEPYLRGGGFVAGLPAWMRVFQSGDGKSAVVLSNALLDAIVIPVVPLELGVTVWTRGPCGSVYLCALYCRHGQPLVGYLQYLERVFTNLPGTPVLAGLDANAVSRLWHSKNRIRGAQNAARGEELEAFIVAHDLEVLNEPSGEFTFDGPMGRSDIDVTLGKGIEGVFRLDWSVRSDLINSDHNAIVVTLSRASGSADLPVPIFRWRSVDVDWATYGSALADAIEELPQEMRDSADPAALVGAIADVLRGVNDAVLGAAVATPRRRTRWWSQAIRAAKSLAGRCRRSWQQARRDRGSAEVLAETRSAYRRADRSFKQLVLQRKEADWRSFVGEVGNTDPWGDVYRICRGGRGPADIGGIRVGGVQASSWGESARALLGHFFPRLPPGADVDDGLLEDLEVPAPVSAIELHRALGRMRLRSAPGPDGITVAMLRALVSSAPLPVLAMYNRCLAAGYFPPQWKCARVVAILKAPGRPADCVGSYRPISLLSVFGKLLEKVLVRRLEGRADHALSDRQFGFRVGRSTDDAWHAALGVVRESPCEYVLGTFVDFRGAFDHLSWSVILRTLASAGCPEIGVWRSFFSERTAHMTSRYDRVEVDVVRGCPQGSMSGPILWNLAMDGLLRDLGRLGVEAVAFADDILLLTPGDSRRALEVAASAALEVVQAWGDRVSVDVSRDKTVCMLLRGRLARCRPPRVTLRPGVLRYSSPVKYLGIWVSEGLNFSPHLHELRERGVALVSQLQRVLRRDWGLRRRAIGALYRGLFLPCAMYGASVWGGYVRTRVVARTLINRAQRAVLYGVLPVCRTVSTEAMTVLMGELPWDLDAKKWETRYFLRKGLPMPEGLPVSDGDVASGGDVGELLDAALWAEWRDRWVACPKGGVTRDFIPDPASVAELVRVVGFGLHAGFLLTGHGSLNAFLYRRTLADTPRCPCGYGEETSLHLLTECPLYAERRDLDAMGIYRDGAGSWTLHRATASAEAFQALKSFAGWAFALRPRPADGD